MVTVEPTPPMSNAERQRLFRERHPGYYQRLHAKRRAAIKAGAAQLVAAARATAVKRVPLALPAPVVIIQLPAMSMVPAVLVPSPLPASEQATIPPLAAKPLAA